MVSMRKWAATWQNQQSDCTPSEDSDQHGHSPSLIRVFVVHMNKAWVLNYPLSAQWMPRLIWVFAGRTLTLLILSCGGSNVLFHWSLGFETGIRIVSTDPKQSPSHNKTGNIYRSAQEKSSVFAFTPRTKILKREPFFSPQDFAECLLKISRRYSAKTRSHLKKR